MIDILDLTKNSLIGQAVGDAMGVPVEFCTREEVRRFNITEMEGYDTCDGIYGKWSKRIPAGVWSDDTSMAVAAMVSIYRNHGKIDYDDVMQHFLDWWEGGYYTPLRSSFGLGGTCSIALNNYTLGCPALLCGPTTFDTNGNGSLMRILPFSLYSIFKAKQHGEIVQIVNNASSITHGHEISKLGCFIFTLMLDELSNGQDIKQAWEVVRKFNYKQYYTNDAIEAYAQLLSDDFLTATDDAINQTGYVVDTMMATVYSLLNSIDYESAILTAINLGGDTDTYAAVTGALAGVRYGIDKIPMRWLERLIGANALVLVASCFADTMK